MTNMDDAAYTSNAQSAVSISGGGGQRGGNEILVDGIPNTVARSGGIALFVPSLNSVHKRSKTIDANNWLNNRLGLPKSPINYNQRPIRGVLCGSS